MVKFYLNEEVIESIRFPITDVGTTSTVSLIIENDYFEKIELIPYAEDRDISISEYPKTLQAGEKAKTVWSFSPTKERRRSLKAVCGFKEIIGD